MVVEGGGVGVGEEAEARDRRSGGTSTIIHTKWNIQ